MSNKKVSETETEWLFKDLLKDNGYLTDGDLIVEFKDKTDNEKLKKRWKMRAKKGIRKVFLILLFAHTNTPILFS